MTRLLSVFLIASLSLSLFAGDEFSIAPDTQKPGERPPTPQESLEMITVPEGFQVTLFAAEPDIRQPIDMKFDSRGRLWVAECYAYNGGSFDDDVHDRILILEDTDRDGQHDTSKVFWDQGHILTSFEFGNEGIYILNDGELQFLSDKDHDDQADAKIVTLMNGFDTEHIGHNIVSGLMWGPDGWIYGRHGIKATSYPAPPHVPMDEREPMNTGIWRYHPVNEVFEPVVHGTTNPWGLDYNADGEFFFTNNVIGHMWHVIPGAHYKRMFGQDFNPHVYSLMDQHADHYHWDASQKWTDSREGAGVHGELGGGHSHCGGMIYLGDDFPVEYRGRMFMCNTHGRRVNQDIIEREGSGYVIKHAPDFMFANQPWFRGVSLVYGPDGAVYVSDWCDFGECHDRDGIHRSSGRIYRISYGEPNPVPENLDIATMSLDKLFELQKHSNHWYRRTARREFWNRQQRGEKYLIPEWNTAITSKEDRSLSLESVQTLVTLGLWNEVTVNKLLLHSDPAHRHYGLRLAGQLPPEKLDGVGLLLEAIAKRGSPADRLHLLSTVQKLPQEHRLNCLQLMATSEVDPDDHNLPLMIWYGLEPLVVDHPDEALSIAQFTNLPQLQQFLARRLTSEIAEHPTYTEQLVAILQSGDTNRQRNILLGMSEALRGWRRVDAPRNWSDVALPLSQSKDAEIRKLSQQLSIVFGDGRAMDDLITLALNSEADYESRQRAVSLLSQAGNSDLEPLLLKLLPDRNVTPAVLKAMVDFDNPALAREVVKRYLSFRAEWKPLAIQALTSREAFASVLLDAIADGKIPSGEVSAAQAREIQNLGNPDLNQKLTAIWGTLRQTPAEKQELIAEYKERLSQVDLTSVDYARGRALFNKSCGNCHKLFGEGAEIAPDLTGSNRDNLDYLLMNILDPSGVVPQAFKVSVVVLTDGRVLTGVIGRDDGQTIEIQTAKDKVIVAKSDIEVTKASDLSLMPDGLFEKLTEAEIRDLIGYLQSRRAPTR
ncbi:MAG: c-type cytochrome [Planctomycetaceae bacterium]|nr:c-type cytochrome [Planctomycetaceae bacterium]